jgi:hypothetical protein
MTSDVLCYAYFEQKIIPFLVIKFKNLKAASSDTQIVGF